ncbi:MAG: ATP-grasp domain-containing protein [Rhizobacter sp.]|nr:ATP-grasp domain-containing protein [Ferruginibacter sp.]
MESKWEMYQDAPEGFFPFTAIMKPAENFVDQFKKTGSGFQFPVIAKPAIGSKGQGVAVIKDVYALQQYHHTCSVDYLVQQKIDYPMEAGIFYVCLPGEAKGIITGIVEKEFIQVTGNGQDSIETLLLQNPRYLLQVKSLRQILLPEIMNEVLPNGDRKILLDIGNHARGAYFINASHRINDLLTATINNVCTKFPGFYYGRLDIRFNSWEQLSHGNEFAVIELNGSGSEPTHIYDPANSITHAWQEICRHWHLMYVISRHNHKKKGIAYLSFKKGIQLLQSHVNYNKKLQLLAKDAYEDRQESITMIHDLKLNTTGQKYAG